MTSKKCHALELLGVACRKISYLRGKAKGESEIFFGGGYFRPKNGQMELTQIVTAVLLEMPPAKELKILCELKPLL
jgi:hypothetical protein